MCPAEVIDISAWKFSIQSRDSDNKQTKISKIYGMRDGEKK